MRSGVAAYQDVATLSSPYSEIGPHASGGSFGANDCTVRLIGP
jgi:hypothetical protein